MEISKELDSKNMFGEWYVFVPHSILDQMLKFHPVKLGLKAITAYDLGSKSTKVPSVAISPKQGKQSELMIAICLLLQISNGAIVILFYLRPEGRNPRVGTPQGKSDILRASERPTFFFHPVEHEVPLRAC